MATHTLTTPEPCLQPGQSPRARRGFLAVVGGALVAGLVQRATAATPTLILPPKLLPASSLDALKAAGLSGHPLLDGIRDRGESQMHAILEVKAALPGDLFSDWLESGLCMAAACKPGGGIDRAMQIEGRV